jgi:hypothetical protein
VREAAERSGAALLVPRPGERVDVLDPPELVDWWTAVGSETDAGAPGDAAGAGRPGSEPGRPDLTRRS